MNPKSVTRRASYSSPTIRARRARILDVTRELIAEQGVSRFSVSEVGIRANVAKQTIYNIFQTKERMIATAINEYFEEREQQTEYQSPPATMERMIERTIVAGRKAQSIPNYLSAIMAIYHSLDPDPEIWAAIHRATMHADKPWVETLAHDGALQSWVVPSALIEDLALLRNAVILKWCRGELDDDEWLRRKVVGCLTTIAGAALGPARAQVEAKLEEITAIGLPTYGLPPTGAPAAAVGSGPG